MNLTNDYAIPSDHPELFVEYPKMKYSTKKNKKLKIIPGQMELDLNDIRIYEYDS